MISNIDSVIIVDKPIGISSRDVSSIIKRHFNLSKVGHLGTLDMEASGLLVVLSGRCTKLERYLHSLPKTYDGEILLGSKTVSDDIFSEILESKDVPNFSQEDLDLLKGKFTGTLLQTPPQVSAKKINGKVAYKEVRQGRDIELKPKEVSCVVNKLEKLKDDTLSYSLTCSTGFYVRSFARDLGESLGTFGATKAIRRVAVGDLRVEEGIMIIDGQVQEEGLDKAIYDLNSTSRMIAMPCIELEDEDIANQLKNGNKATLVGLLEGKEDYRAKVYYQGEIISVVSKEGGVVLFEVNF